jgi:hypothetical protein
MRKVGMTHIHLPEQVVPQLAFHQTRMLHLGARSGNSDIHRVVKQLILLQPFL